MASKGQRHAVMTVALALLATACTRESSEGEVAKPPAPERTYATASDPFEPLPHSIDHDKRAAALGQRLFADKILSDDGKVACTDCHKITKDEGGGWQGGADGRRVAHLVDENGKLIRPEGEINVTSVLNLAFYDGLGWTSKFSDMKEQLGAPMTKPLVMDSEWSHVVKRLQAKESYRAEFERVYSDGVTEANVRRALAEYQRSLITPGSRFDSFLRGESHVKLEPAEEEGYRRFKALGCVSCHQGIGIGGNMVQVFGAMRPYPEERPWPLKPMEKRHVDEGRYSFTNDKDDETVFRVPSLRNVAVTAPYFHDGETLALEDAVNVMAIHQLGRDDVSKRDVCLITAFLLTLTGKFRGELLRQPRLADDADEAERQKRIKWWNCEALLATPDDVAEPATSAEPTSSAEVPADKAPR